MLDGRRRGWYLYGVVVGLLIIAMAVGLATTRVDELMVGVLGVAGAVATLFSGAVPAVDAPHRRG